MSTSSGTLAPDAAGLRPGAEPALSLRGVGVRFGGIRAVNDVSLNLSPGEVVGLIGPNGAGKTTLLDSISGLRVPDEGQVMLAGRDVTSSSPEALARVGVRRTFQRHQAFGWLTVRENVMIPLEWRSRGRGLLGDLFGLPGRRREAAEHLARVDEVLDLCGLSDVRDINAAELPIGRLRLLEFARAIVDAPSVFLLDEPTSGLGQAETELMGSILRDLVSHHEITVVLVEHDVEFVMNLATRVVCLVEGSVLADGTPEQIRGDERVIAAYLGS